MAQIGGLTRASASTIKRPVPRRYRCRRPRDLRRWLRLDAGRDAGARYLPLVELVASPLTPVGRTRPEAGSDGDALSAEVDTAPRHRAGLGDGMRDQRTADILAVVIENRELGAQLAETQDQCVELAVDAGELHVDIEALRARLARVERERDAWRAEAERGRRTG